MILCGDTMLSSILLEGATYLIFAVEGVHSILGERDILMRLFRGRDLPRLFGGAAAGTSRYAGSDNARTAKTRNRNYGLPDAP